MKKIIYVFILILFLAPICFAVPECPGNIVKTRMGDICVWSSKQKHIIDSYMSSYINYLYENFDVNKISFLGRKYSNKRLYNVYRYIIHKDGTITNIVPVVLENPQYDKYVKTFILKYLPAPLLEGMPDEMKVELEVTQGIAVENVGVVGYIWSEYYRIIFEKGVFNNAK